jgi:hypothetical protein
MTRKRATRFAVFISTAAKTFDTLTELSSIKGPGDELDIILGLDQQKMELYLNDSARHVDVVHLIAHGSESVLQFDNGVVTEAELVTLLEPQRANLKFVIISACDSYDTGLAIHNTLQVPVVAYNGPIDDRAAVTFARSFYATLRSCDSGLDAAVQRGRDSLSVAYPAEARKVRVINGQMLTAAAVGTKIDLLERNQDEIRDTLLRLEKSVGTLTTGLDEMRGDLHQSGKIPKWLILLFLCLLIIQVIAQIATPFVDRYVSIFVR